MIRPPSLGGSLYFVSFTDDFSRYTWLYFLSTKSHTFHSFQLFKVKVEKLLGKQILAVRSDQGGEFLSKEFNAFCDSEGIHRELTQAYTPRQNDVSERKNMTLLEKARAMVANARTLHFLWSEAVNCANYLTNRSPTRANREISPFQRLFGKAPNIANLRIYGCVAHVHVPDEKWTKLDSKSVTCLLLDYFEDTKAYQCYNPVTRKILVNGDVKFDKHRFWYSPPQPGGRSSVSIEPLTDDTAAIKILDPDYASSETQLGAATPSM